MSDRPLVTVGLSTYDAGPLLRPAVDSVLSQTYRELELIVVDDGSTDGSLASLNDIDDQRLVILCQANRGKAEAFNRILDQARGRYLAIQDADDVSHPRRIEAQVERLEADPRLGGCFTQHELIIDGRHLSGRLAAQDESFCASRIEAMTPPGHDPTVMFRLSALAAIRFDPALRIGETVDVILQVGERYPLVVIGECLYSYRVHPSTSRGLGQEILHWEEAVARRAYARRGLNFEEFLALRRRQPPRRNLDEPHTLSHFVEATLDYRLAGRHGEALRIALQCAALHPALRDYYRPLAYALAPRGLVRRRRPDRVPITLARSGPSSS